MWSCKCRRDTVGRSCEGEERKKNKHMKNNNKDKIIRIGLRRRLTKVTIDTQKRKIAVSWFLVIYIIIIIIIMNILGA